MRFRRRLRSRIILSFLLLGTLLSGLFAVSVLSLQNYLEDQLIGATLAQELDDYVGQLREDPSVVEPFYTRIQGYVTRPGDPNRSVEASFRDLDSGVHDVQTIDGFFKAAVLKEEDLWAFLIYDVSENRALTGQLKLALAGVVVFFSMLSLAMGLWLSTAHLDRSRQGDRLVGPITDRCVGRLLRHARRTV